MMVKEKVTYSEVKFFIPFWIQCLQREINTFIYSDAFRLAPSDNSLGKKGREKHDIKN